MFEFVPIKHGGGVIVDSKPQQKFEKPDNCILECVQNAIDAAKEINVCLPSPSLPPFLAS